MAYPNDYRYTKEHEWIQAKGNTGLVGITDYAQKSLGDIVFVKLPDVGAQITKDQIFGGIDSVKAFSDLFAPASGKVVEVNGDIVEKPEKVNEDAHSAWMIRMELKDPKEVDSLLSAQEYESYIAEEKQ